MLQLFTNGGGAYFKLAGLPLLAVAFLLGPSPAAGAEESAAASTEATAPCKGLRPFTDMGELMHQIYINLESDCLFRMDPEELSKIWRIPTLEVSDHREAPDNNYSRKRREPLKGDHDHLVLIVAYHPDFPHMVALHIRLAHDRDPHQYLFFPDYKFPEQLPPPVIYDFLSPPYSVEGVARCTKGQFGPDNRYVWFNADKTRMLSMQSGCSIIYSISVSDHVPPFFIHNYPDED